MSRDGIRFVGLQLLEGAEHLPCDLVLDLGAIREWANSRGMISDPEFQLLGPERLADISQVWSPDDQLLIAISISGEGTGALDYFEYAYVPVRTLIRREMAITLVYWSVHPVSWDMHGKPLEWGEARFGFWVSGCADEFCSVSGAKLIVPKFVALVNAAAEAFDVETKPDGSRKVTAEGAYTARFRKARRQFDVDIRSTPSA